jgi:hypothetical protein
LDEVDRRWRIGLAEAGYRRCDTFHELATAKWNAYAGQQSSHARANGTPPPDYTDASAYKPVSLLERS